MKQIINTELAPAPVGPYNQAIRAGDTLYCSGQIAINPATGALVLDDIATETRQVLENVKAVLAAAGATLDQVVKCTIFMSSMDHYQAINAVYAEYFGEVQAPAREAVAVKTLPKAVNVEISVTAYLG